MPLRSLFFALVVLTLPVGAVRAEGDLPDHPEPRPGVGAAWPAPRALLPEMPESGDGTYRLNLDQALGATPFTLVVEFQSGTAVRAAGLPNRTAQAWCPVDASDLKLVAGKRLHGSVNVQFPTVFEPKRHRRTVEGKPNARYEPFALQFPVSATIHLDVDCLGLIGDGRWSAVWQGAAKLNPLGHSMQRGTAGTVTLRREPLRLLPAQFQCDLYLHAALAGFVLGSQEPENSAIWLRTAFEENKPATTLGHIAWQSKVGDQPVSRLRFSELAIHCRHGRLTGSYAASVEGVNDSDFRLDLEGLAIGRRLVGTATVRRGAAQLETQWIGLLHDITAWPLPRELLPTRWEWRHDQPVDRNLAERALRESLAPVMPGEPGKAGFWTWRKLSPQSPVSTIYPPCFDLQETEGAARYRFDIRGVKETVATAQFISDKPWRPLTQAWPKLPPGNYQLVVVPLDAAGLELPRPMRMGILDKATAQPGATELASIPFIKRPAFAGPYAQRPGDEYSAALAIGRWHRAHPGLYERRGIGISPSGNAWTTGGDHGYGVAVADRLWCNLAVRDLTDDISERLFAEEMLAFNLEDLELHQRVNNPHGYIYDYQGATPLAYWIGTAVLDAYLATADVRWREVALKLGQALVDQQKANGAFYSPRVDIRDPTTRRGPHGFFTWREGATEFGAAELLYFFGRLRRDLKTEAFVESETRAYRWVLENGVRQRFWPINVSHSMSTGYPIWQHPVAALYFCRYLLECAPPQQRDLKLAAEVARWAEDVGVDWTRAAEGQQQGPITPRINALDRYNNEPIAVNVLAGVVFEELAQATGDRLWAAKAQALVTAALQGFDPSTGQPATNLTPNCENHCPIARGYGDPAHYRHWDFCKGWAAQLFREYAALRKDRP